MSEMGFQKKLDVGGWGELYPSLFWIFFNFAKPLNHQPIIVINVDISLLYICSYYIMYVLESTGFFF